MKKLLAIFVILAFFAPVFRPLAYANEHTACNIATQDCKHGDACPMKHHRKAKEFKEVKKAVCHTGHQVQEEKPDACDSYIKCKAEESSSAMSVSAADETYFNALPIAFEFIEAHQNFVSLNTPIYKDALAPLPEKPPANI
ncbi:MAG: hypothetical protein HYS21_05590 [Deltaproteobacteria bacterium]|nr:hypothetical protein [Deltaproteobacteria bacterium]